VKRLFFSEEALKVAREALEKKNEKSNGLTPEGLLLQQLQSVLRYVSESKPFPEPIGAVTQFIIHLLIENKYIQLVDNQ